ncbi:MAG: hypothetical protein NZ879_02815 [Archaeoglobaceae archaeon]|nr:hypothetical protein [Archaeoglobaceae archaeon]MDW8117897.1 hypothetical protein [Archaeoglobaceae archaeon]
MKFDNLKAVSEVVGALMVLLMIVTVAGILYTMSYPVVWSGQDNVKFRNSFFDLFELREKIERVRSGLEPMSAHKIQFYDNSIEFKNEPIIRIGNVNYTVASIKIRGSGWTLTYENGAIIENRGNARMLSAPNINYNNGTLYLPIIILKGKFSAGGRGEVNLFLSLNNSYPLSGNNTIVIYSSNIQAWKEFFNVTGVRYTSYSNRIEIPSVNYYAVVYEVGIK